MPRLLRVDGEIEKATPQKDLPHYKTQRNAPLGQHVPLPNLPESIRYKGGNHNALPRAYDAGAQVHWLEKRLPRNGGSFGLEDDCQKLGG